VNGVPCASLKCDWLHSRRCCSMVSGLHMVIHLSGVSGLGTSSEVRLPGVEGLRCCCTR